MSNLPGYINGEFHLIGQEKVEDGCLFKTATLNMQPEPLKQSESS